MPNPLYQHYFPNMGAGQFPQGTAGSSFFPPVFRNPAERAQYIMQALMNPAAFVRQQFPDIPNNIQNDPSQIFNYLQRTRNPVSDQQVQRAQQMAGQIAGIGTVK